MSEKKSLIGKGVFFVPKIANDKDKRQNIKSVRKSRREALKNASTKEEKKAIREDARQNIRAERGGVSQVREIFTDVKDFSDQVNQLKSNIQGTTVGRVASLAKNLIGHISSGNFQAIANDVGTGAAIAQRLRNKTGAIKKQTNNNCN
jgi:hypothetical protein